MTVTQSTPMRGICRLAPSGGLIGAGLKAAQLVAAAQLAAAVAAQPAAAVQRAAAPGYQGVLVVLRLRLLRLELLFPRNLALQPSGGVGNGDSGGRCAQIPF